MFAAIAIIYFSLAYNYAAVPLRLRAVTAVSDSEVRREGDLCFGGCFANVEKKKMDSYSVVTELIM